MADVDVPELLRSLGIEAKRQGREWLALCPNPGHEDREPSWRIRDEKGSKKHGAHHCWPCGFGGGPLALVEAVLGISRAAARDWLAGEGVAIERPVAASVEVRSARWDRRFRLPAGVEVAPVASWPGSARAYLVEERGIRAEEADRWGTGFATAGRLAGRIVFVKRGADGTPEGYSARAFDGSKPKYLEPRKGEGASPAAVFGEQFWPPVDRRAGARVFVVEGALNALAIAQATGEFVGALSGSDLHPNVAAKLASFGDVVGVSDPDAAGDSVSKRLADALARHATTYRRAKFPTGEDAASVAKKRGADALRSLLEAA